jgi:hypothetical protein
MMVRGSAILATALWCMVAWLLWPEPESAPHPPGAWLPLVSLAVATLLSGLVFAVTRRWRQTSLPTPTPAAMWEPAR